MHFVLCQSDFTKWVIVKDFDEENLIREVRFGVTYFALKSFRNVIHCGVYIYLFFIFEVNHHNWESSAFPVLCQSSEAVSFELKSVKASFRILEVYYRSSPVEKHFHMGLKNN